MSIHYWPGSMRDCSTLSIRAGSSSSATLWTPIVSSGNKASQYELRTFVEKSSNLIMQGVHVLDLA